MQAGFAPGLTILLVIFFRGNDAASLCVPGTSGVSGFQICLKPRDTLTSFLPDSSPLLVFPFPLRELPLDWQ